MLRRTGPPLALAASLLLFSPPASVADRDGFMRGMVVSCPQWGPIWGSPAMAETLAHLRSLGVGHVAIHPYGWLSANGSIRFHPAGELDFLERAVVLAENAGIGLLWKPHLGYWSSGFSHRGAIDFGDNPAAWARFFREYEAFIVDQAHFAEAAGVGLFAVGVELDRTIRYEAVWRRIISSVRSVYSGRILYAANWDQIFEVPFWDAVDLVGVHAYFPLSERSDPTHEELMGAWDEILAELERLSRSTGKRVLIAEIGYNTSPDAARTPWAYETVANDVTRNLRARLIDVAITRLESADYIDGMFWWKWMPGNDRGRNFSMRDQEALEVLEHRWAPQPFLSTPR